MRPLRLAVLGSLLALAACAGSEAAPVNDPVQAVRDSTPPTSVATTPSAKLPKGGDPRIAAAGDIACQSSQPGPDSCRQQFTSDLLVGQGLAKVLALGDSQYEDGTFQQFRDFFDPTWGRVKPKIRPSVGNHEYQTPGAQGYFQYFGRRAGPPRKGYYSFEVGTWHVISLNSNCGVVSCAPGSQQEQWLRAKLAAHSNTCTLAYWHHPRWSSGTTHGGNDDVAPFVEALYEFGADVILVGHEHNYERFAPQNPDGELDNANGIREIVVGTGGKTHHPFGTPEPNSQVRNATTYGVLILTLHPASYDWEFVPEAGETFTDSGAADCH